MLLVQASMFITFGSQTCINWLWQIWEIHHQELITEIHIFKHSSNFKQFYLLVLQLPLLHTSVCIRKAKLK